MRFTHYITPEDPHDATYDPENIDNIDPKNPKCKIFWPRMVTAIDFPKDTPYDIAHRNIPWPYITFNDGQVFHSYPDWVNDRTDFTPPKNTSAQVFFDAYGYPPHNYQCAWVKEPAVPEGGIINELWGDSPRHTAEREQEFSEYRAKPDKEFCYAFIDLFPLGTAMHWDIPARFKPRSHHAGGKYQRVDPCKDKRRKENRLAKEKR
jgi:hypothetical protein